MYPLVHIEVHFGHYVLLWGSLQVYSIPIFSNVLRTKEVIYGVKFMCRIHKVLAFVLRSVCSQFENATPLPFEVHSLGMGGASVATAELVIAAC
jgi:hypothetical protein